MSVCLTGLLENPVDVEDAVEVIHFMLEDYCGEAADRVADGLQARYSSVFNHNLLAAGNILAAVRN